jgi:hypothetical protein
MSSPTVEPITDGTAIREALEVVRTVVPGFEPVAWERLKQGKSEVFAVHGAGSRHPLVAKCASKDSISVEHRVLAWLISEYAVGEPYDLRSSTHRRIAGKWMGDLHTWSASVLGPNLPLQRAVWKLEAYLDRIRAALHVLDAATAS